MNRRRFLTIFPAIFPAAKALASVEPTAIAPAAVPQIKPNFTPIELDNLEPPVNIDKLPGLWCCSGFVNFGVDWAKDDEFVLFDPKDHA